MGLQTPRPLDTGVTPMTFDGTPQATIQKCSVLDAVSKSFRFVIGNLPRFIALSWFAIVIATASSSASGIFAHVISADSRSQTTWIGYLGSAITIFVQN